MKLATPAKATIRSAFSAAADVVDTHVGERANMQSAIRAVSLHSLTHSAAARQFRTLAVQAMGKGVDAGEVTAALSVTIQRWREVASDVLRDRIADDGAFKKEQRSVINAATYSLKVVSQVTGYRAKWQEKEKAYKVEKIEARAEKTLSADGNEKETNAATREAAAITTQVKSEVGVLAQMATDELLRELAKRYDSAADMLAAVESLPVALFKAATVENKAAGKTAGKGKKSGSKSSGKKSVTVGREAVTIADVAPAELVGLLSQKIGRAATV